MRDELFPAGLEPLLGAMAQRLAAEWAEREVEVLTSAQAALLHARTDPRRGDQYCLSLLVPQRLYRRTAQSRERLEQSLLSCARGFLPRAAQDKLVAVSLGPLLTADDGWRERALAWLEGRGRRAQQVRPEAPPRPAAWREVRVEVRAALQPQPRPTAPLGAGMTSEVKERVRAEEARRRGDKDGWIRLRGERS